MKEYQKQIGAVILSSVGLFAGCKDSKPAGPLPLEVTIESEGTEIERASGHGLSNGFSHVSKGPSHAQEYGHSYQFSYGHSEVK